MARLRFLVPANIRHNSGGNAFNARLVTGLESLGAKVQLLAIEGTWPDASANQRRRLGSLLGAWDHTAGTAADSGWHPTPPIPPVTIVDGLVAVGAPDEMEWAAKARQNTWVLVHMPVPASQDPGPQEKEGRALRAATGVICTSATAAATLAARHNLRRIHTARPGVAPAALAAGSAPPHILAVAALLPNKDQLLAVSALARLQDLDWTAALVGSDQADPGYAVKVRAAITANGLNGRVRVPGELAGQELANEWHAADLSLLVSRAEAFGMVVTESLARGIPAVVRHGTGAVEALGLAGLVADDGGPRLPGTTVAFPEGGADSPARLAGVLRNWLTKPATRTEWRDAAGEARKALPGWAVTAQSVLDALAGA